MSQIDDAVTAIDVAVDDVATKLADLKVDFDAAVAKLQADIAAGGVTPATLAALATIGTKLGAASTAIGSIDSAAEAISGNPTP